MALNSSSTKDRRERQELRSKFARVYDHLRSSLGKRRVRSPIPNDSFCADMRRITLRGDAADEAIVAALASEIDSMFDLANVADQPYLTGALLLCGSYYDYLGDSAKALRLTIAALEQATTLQNQSLLRRAHSMLGGFYCRVFEFDAACVHIEKAFSIAVKSGDLAQILAVTTNAVAALKTMGLLSEAQHNAHFALQHGCHSEIASIAQVTNSANAVEICHALNDMPAAERFLNAALSELVKCKVVMSDSALAYLEANRVNHLVRCARVDEALSIINEAIGTRVGKNKRVDATLYCAQAGVHSVKNDPKLLEESRVRLEQILRESNIGTDREEVLRRLIEVLSASPDDTSERLEFYRCAYRDYLVNFKHQKVYQDTFRTNRKRLNLFSFPRYNVPTWLTDLGMRSGFYNVSESASRGQWERLQTNVDRIGRSGEEIGEASASAEFSAAESYALFAEFQAEGSSSHCFLVGRFAGFIASRLGIEPDRCRQIQLACRLHDVGKVELAFDKPKLYGKGMRSGDDYRKIVSHTTTGAALLGRSADETLALAAQVARYHHECWNGTGYPQGLAGDAIPLPARICAVADALACLVLGPSGEPGWSLDAAGSQLQCMAGVQLDPSIVETLSEMTSLTAIVRIAAEQDRNVQIGYSADIPLCQS